MMDAAERICGAFEEDQIDVLDGLGTLVEHSLVRVEAADGSEPRYGMLQVTREYAATRLSESPARDAVEQRHAEWILDLVETAEPELVLRDLRSWQERLRREEDNVRTALRWAIERGAAGVGQRIAGSCWQFWNYWGGSREGISWLESVLDLPDARAPSEPRVRALTALARLWWHQGRGAESLTLYKEVIDLRRALGDDERLRDAIEDASWVAWQSGDGELAWRLVEEKWRYPRRPGSPSFDGWMDRGAELAVREFWHRDGSYEKAIAPMEAMLGGLQRSEQALFAADATNATAVAHYRGGHAELALRRGREALRLYGRLGHIVQQVVMIQFLAACEQTVGRPLRAVRLAVAAKRLASDLGGIVGSRGGPATRFTDRSAEARSELSAVHYARAVAEGNVMSLDEAIAYALSKATHHRGPEAGRRRDPNALTPRELDVLDLVSAGRTDPEIGEALFISPKTASAHVSSIKGKLGARSRAEIVAIALRGDAVVDDPYAARGQGPSRTDGGRRGSSVADAGSVATRSDDGMDRIRGAEEGVGSTS